MFLFQFILYRMDGLVYSTLDKIGWEWGLTWWIFMFLIVLVTSFMLFSSCGDKQGLWYFIFFLLLYIGDIQNLFYIFNIPTPVFLRDPNFIYFWNIFYILFGYPWTLKEEICLWVLIWSLLAGIYLYMRRRFNIYGLIKNE